MKTLTHYFTSPKNTCASNDEYITEENKVPKLKNCPEINKRDEKFEGIEKFVEKTVDNDVISSSENVSENVGIINVSTCPAINSIVNDSDKAKVEPINVLKELDSIKMTKKRKKLKKIKRKHSDPAVNGITDLLSTSLSIVSPNTSFNDKINEDESKVFDKNIRLDNSPENGITNLEITPILNMEKDSVETSPKVNVFKFMMNNRQSLSRSSSGKEVLAEEESLDSKGAAKRKRDEEEQETPIKRIKPIIKEIKKSEETSEETINKDFKKEVKEIIKVKMFTPKNSKKKSRLSLKKKALEENSSEIVDEEENKSDTPTVKNRKRKPKFKILDSDDSSRDSVHPATVETKINNNHEDHEVEKLPEVAPEAKNVLEEEIIVENLTEPEEEAKEIIKVKMFNNKKSKRKNRLTLKKETPKENPEVEETTFAIKKRKRHQKFKIMDSDDSNSDFSALLPNKETVKAPDVTTRMSLRSRHLPEKTVLLDSGSDGETPKINKKKKKAPTKTLAPVFMKAVPKPKVDPEVAEAKRKFLLSGIPSTLKKIVEKQQSIEEKEFDVFPVVSHVQQKNPSESFWNLPDSNLKLTDLSPLKTDNLQLTCNNLIVRDDDCLRLQVNTQRVDKLKQILREIKRENPNYPIYRSFRQINEKCHVASATKSPGKNKKNKRKSAEVKLDSRMWTDKYQPSSSEDIIGNQSSVSALKKWLKTWLDFSEEIVSKKQRKRSDSNTSESEFDTTDGDSRDSFRMPRNTIILGGTIGSGKSTAVYAICNELGLNVLELNASSKRTGKRLLQELQEATQSHQVRKKNSTLLKAFLGEEVSKNETQVSQKMCVLLVEDVDLVFDQDDGFISALLQLVQISKRPIILTTTDANSLQIQRFVSQYKLLKFVPLTARVLSTWLQILCLVEGLFVDSEAIGSLLEYNKGDVRRTLLHLQFCVQTGGDFAQNAPLISLKNERKRLSAGKEIGVKDEEPLGDKGEVCGDFEGKKQHQVHFDCIRSVEVFRRNLPVNFKLGFVWWNLPNLLGLPSFSSERLNKFPPTNSSDKNSVKISQKLIVGGKNSLSERAKLNCLSQLYDSLALVDVSNKIIKNSCQDFEPCSGKLPVLKDSLELFEKKEDCNGNLEVVEELSHSLINGYIEEYKKIENCVSHLNMAAPVTAEKCWRDKHNSCAKSMQDVVPMSSYLDRKSLNLDYFPTLRNIVRSENQRASTNTKRGNRFRHYLRDLGVNYEETTYKFSCNILQIKDDVG